MIASMAFGVTAWEAEVEYSGTFCGIQRRNVLYSRIEKRCSPSWGSAEILAEGAVSWSGAD